jgi:hypothetical protein
MSWSPDSTPLVCIVVEGAVDRFCGGPRDQNPYSPTYAEDYWLAWDFGWQDSDHLLDERGTEEAQRWLKESS